MFNQTLFLFFLVLFIYPLFYGEGQRSAQGSLETE
jgi:hypothetical protein